jgi:ferredoxin-thioredoxin reductase catalytic subunit
MIGLKDKSKRVAEMIMFCLENKRKMETIVNCYCQLVLKKQDLQKGL